MDIPNYYADSMAFFGLQGRTLPLFSLVPSKRPMLSLAHLTSVPPLNTYMESFDAAFVAHNIFRKQALANRGVHVVRIQDDLNRQGMGLVFGMQHAPKHMTWLRMQKLRSADLQIMALAYNGPTEYGHGFMSDGGLTTYGRKLIEWMAECNMILDVSHANHQTAYEALEFILQEGLPVHPMASHTGCYSVAPHRRNLKDDSIGLIAALKGYIGLLCITFFIAHKGDDYFAAFARHVEHAMLMSGSSGAYVGVGSDCNHMDMTMSEASEHYAHMTKMLTTAGTLGEYFPDRPPELILDGSKMFQVIHEALGGLKSAPFLPHVLHTLLGVNFKRFLNRSLPRR